MFRTGPGGTLVPTSTLPVPLETLADEAEKSWFHAGHSGRWHVWSDAPLDTSRLANLAPAPLGALGAGSSAQHAAGGGFGGTMLQPLGGGAGGGQEPFPMAPLTLQHIAQDMAGTSGAQRSTKLCNF